MEDFEFDVTPEDLALYDLEQKNRTKWFIENSPDGVKFDWQAPQLDEDGSLSYESRQEETNKIASAAWSGTRRV
jgi:hypothetical protein